MRAFSYSLLYALPGKRSLMLPERSTMKYKFGGSVMAGISWSPHKLASKPASTMRSPLSLVPPLPPCGLGGSTNEGACSCCPHWRRVLAMSPIPSTTQGR